MAKPRPIRGYAHQAGRWQPAEAAVASPPHRLSVLTLNTWFAPDHGVARYRALVERLESTDADVICLQEVVPDLLYRLEAAEWVRDECLIVVGERIADSYGLLVLSRLPVSRAWELPFQSVMARSLLAVQLGSGPDSLTVATTHLESTREMSGARVQQLECAFEALSAAPAAVLCGDFNFDPRGVEQAALEPRFVDAWSSRGLEEPGFTVDTVRNGMLQGRSAKQVRYDRVLACLPGRRAQAQLFGADEIGEGLWVSDHFGVHASFEPE